MPVTDDVLSRLKVCHAFQASLLDYFAFLYASAGADLWQGDVEGLAPLHYAARHNRVEVGHNMPLLLLQLA